MGFNDVNRSAIMSLPFSDQTRPFVVYQLLVVYGGGDGIPTISHVWGWGWCANIGHVWGMGVVYLLLIMYGGGVVYQVVTIGHIGGGGGGGLPTVGGGCFHYNYVATPMSAKYTAHCTPVLPTCVPLSLTHIPLPGHFVLGEL